MLGIVPDPSMAVEMKRPPEDLRGQNILGIGLMATAPVFELKPPASLVCSSHNRCCQLSFSSPGLDV